MAELTMREAVAAALAQEMRRDDRVIVLGEDVQPGGVFKATAGLLEEFGPSRVRNTPISEQAILGAAMGAAMTGMRPVAEIMFADFLAVAWDYIANEIPKFRYMSDGQGSLPLVVRSANGGGTRMGPQHSQAVENWVMAIPGLKVVSPSTPADTAGLLAAAIRDPDPVIFLESKVLYSSKQDVPDAEFFVPLGKATVIRQGRDATLVSLGSMVPRALEAAGQLADVGLDVSVIDLRTLVPLDISTVLTDVARTGCLFTVEENPRLCGWGAEISSLVAEDAFEHLDGPIVRITTPHIPLAFAGSLEDAAMPSVARIVETVSKRLNT